MTNKEIFCSYLEETAAELRGFACTKSYLDDVCSSLIVATNQFWREQEEENALKVVK